MVKLPQAGQSEPDTLLGAALSFLHNGVDAFPTLPDKKHPLVKWQAEWDGKHPDAAQLAEWFEGFDGARGIWVRCNANFVVIDCDSDEADRFWRGQGLGDAMDATCQVKTKRGTHYAFRLPSGAELSSWNGDGYDVQGSNGKHGVLTAPSEGRTWVAGRGLHALLTLTPEQVEVINALGPDRKTGRVLEGDIDWADEDSRFGLAALKEEIAVLVSTPVGNQNNQLNTSSLNLFQLVAGGQLTEETVYAALRQGAADLGMGADVEPTIASGRQAGLQNPRKPQAPLRTDPTSPEYTAGGLIRSGDKMMYMDKEGDPKIWADFDLVSTGTVRDEDGRVDAYEVLIRKDGDLEGIADVLPADVLVEAKKLNLWAVRNEVSIYGDGGRAAPGARLSAYLRGQRAPSVRIVTQLGWDSATRQYVTFDGLLTADGMCPLVGVRPDPNLRRTKQVQFSYGMGDEAEAVQVLREILTFQDETVCSIVGAWFMACHLKGQIKPKVSLFPILALVAPSGHGKTTGFVELMYRLAGSTQGQGVDTRAAFRDRLASHRNGPAWLDDLNDLEQYEEILRAATVEGTFAKKDENNRGNVQAQLVAPVLLSGEGGFGEGQRAMIDRVIQIHLPDPKGRESLRTPGARQWDDILALQERYAEGGLHQFAGTLVKLALRQAGMVSLLPELRPPGNGRYADKLAVLRLGARVLAAITGDELHIKRVDDWVTDQVDTGEENVLTLKILPEALMLFGKRAEPERVDHAPHYGVPTPVIVKPDFDGNLAVWVNITNLAAWWKKNNHGRIQARTETPAALADQATALGMRGGRGKAGVDFIRPRVKGDGGGQPLYQRVPARISDRLLVDFTDPFAVVHGDDAQGRCTEPPKGQRLPAHLQAAIAQDH